VSALETVNCYCGWSLLFFLLLILHSHRNLRSFLFSLEITALDLKPWHSVQNGLNSRQWRRQLWANGLKPPQIWPEPQILMNIPRFNIPRCVKEHHITDITMRGVLSRRKKQWNLLVIIIIIIIIHEFHRDASLEQNFKAAFPSRLRPRPRLGSLRRSQTSSRLGGEPPPHSPPFSAFDCLNVLYRPTVGFSEWTN